MGGDGFVKHRDRRLGGLTVGHVGGDGVAGVVVDELKDHALAPAAEHVLGRIELPARVGGRVDEPPPRRTGLFLRLEASHAGLAEDACQRRGGRDLLEAHRVHLLVHADRSVVQAGGLQSAAHCHGLFLDLIVELRRARLRSSGPRFEHRGRSVSHRAFAQLVERLSRNTVLSAEGRDRPAGRVIRPLRDRQADTRIDGFIDCHHPSLGPELSPPRPPEPSPMS